MKKILLDTNAYSALMRGDANVRTILNNADEVMISLVNIAELRAGFQFGTKASENEMILQAFLKKVRVINPNLETTLEYARLYAALRRSGRALPTNDIWIAALCTQHQLPLLSFDAHFTNLEQVRVITTPEEFANP